MYVCTPSHASPLRNCMWLFFDRSKKSLCVFIADSLWGRRAPGDFTVATQKQAHILPTDISLCQAAEWMKGGWWWWWAPILNLLASRCSFNGFSSVVLLLFLFYFYPSGCVVTAGGEHRGSGDRGMGKLEAFSFVEQPKKKKNRERKKQKNLFIPGIVHILTCVNTRLSSPNR